MKNNVLEQRYGRGLTFGLHGPKMLPVKDRRSQILDVAAQLIAERGYTLTSVDDVIRESKLSGKSHFYHYFKSKEQLGYEVLNRQFERFTERGLAILREPMIDPLDRLNLFVDSLIALQVERLLCDNARALEWTGWKPQVALEEGLRRTSDWVRDHLDELDTAGYSV